MQQNHPIPSHLLELKLKVKLMLKLEKKSHFWQKKICFFFSFRHTYVYGIKSCKLFCDFWFQVPHDMTNEP